MPGQFSGRPKYHHFGLAKGLVSQLKSLILPAKLKDLKLQFNIDGLPLLKSSKLQFWPVVAIPNVDNTKSTFLVGLYCGLGKPESVVQFLDPFVKDLSYILKNGIFYNSCHITVQVYSFVCVMHLQELSLKT